jgi:hypothetical protein
MQTAAEQGTHLRRGHRIGSGKSVDPVHPRPDPHARGLTPFGVIRRQTGVTLLSGIQRRHLPDQIVIPDPAVSLCTLIVMIPNGDSARAAVTPTRGYVPACIRCVRLGALRVRGGTSDGGAYHLSYPRGVDLVAV